MNFSLPNRDVALLSISVMPFFVFSTPVHYTPQSFFLALIVSLVMCFLACSKPVFGIGHLIGRIVLVAAGAWGYAGFVDSRVDLPIPNLGVAAQYVWFLGCFVLFKSRYDHIESVVRNQIRRS